MATPKVVTDGSSDLDEAVLNKFVSSPKSQVKINHCVIDFAASTNTPTVDSGTDSDGEIVTGDLAWSSTEITIALTGYSNVPVVQATICAGMSASNVGGVHAVATSNTSAKIRFVAGDAATAVDPNGDISVNVVVIGY